MLLICKETNAHTKTNVHTKTNARGRFETNLIFNLALNSNINIYLCILFRVIKVLCGDITLSVEGQIAKCR